MFRLVSRRLAILNALVVIAVIAVVGLASYLYLARKIETQTDAELQNRAVSAVELWTNVFLTADRDGVTRGSSATENTNANDVDSKHDDEDHDQDEENERQARELIRSGDTIAYGIDLAGTVVANLRPIEIEHLPRKEPIEKALAGTTIVETVTIEHERIRLRTEPVFDGDRLIGAIQVGMGLGPNERVLDFVRWSTIGGLLLGALLAIPCGWWLANRSMRPISVAFDRQRQFVADAAHELRTPLTLMRAEAEYLQQTPDLSMTEQRESELAIVREVDTMAGLVSSLLQLARMDERAVSFQTERTNLSQIAEAVVERFQSFAADRNISLILESDASVMARCDRMATEQVLAILIDNALDYTGNGGTITVRSEIRAGRAGLVVADTGIGISADDRQRIFDRFYRVDSARSRASGGAGLGLSIAQELMTAQNGSILVESQLGVGSTFVLSFEFDRTV